MVFLYCRNFQTQPVSSANQTAQFWSRALAQVSGTRFLSKFLARVALLLRQKNFRVWYAFVFFSDSTFLHRIERSRFLRKFVQELAWTCINIWRQKLAPVSCTSFFSVWQGHYSLQLETITHCRRRFRSFRIDILVITQVKSSQVAFNKNKWQSHEFLIHVLLLC